MFWVFLFFYVSHCLLLGHYYSVDFPWWFDRKKSAKNFAFVDFEKNREIRVLTSLLKWFDRISFWVCFFSEEECFQKFQIDLEAKRMDVFSWKKNYIISVLTSGVSVVIWFAPWPSVRESRVRIRSPHRNLQLWIKRP